MILLGIHLLNSDQKDSLNLTMTRICKELKISPGTFKKYFLHTKLPNKPKPINNGRYTTYSERDINNFLLNELAPRYKNITVLAANPTKPVFNPNNQYYTLQNMYNIDIQPIPEPKVK